MSFPNARPYLPARQRGAVLVVSLLLLLVMTILALGASQSTRMQERMATNLRDSDIALQSAEAGMRTAERLIDDPNLTAAPFPCIAGRCRVYERNILPVDIAYQTQDWWNNNAWYYAPDNVWRDTAANSIRGDGMAQRDPQFVIEELEEVFDSLATNPGGPRTSRNFYRITSRSYGGTESAQAVLQSTFARRFN